MKYYKGSVGGADGAKAAPTEFDITKQGKRIDDILSNYPDNVREILKETLSNLQDGPGDDAQQPIRYTLFVPDVGSISNKLKDDDEITPEMRNVLKYHVVNSDKMPPPTNVDDIVKYIDEKDSEVETVEGRKVNITVGDDNVVKVNNNNVTTIIKGEDVDYYFIDGLLELPLVTNHGSEVTKATSREHGPFTCIERIKTKPGDRGTFQEVLQNANGQDVMEKFQELIQ